MFRVWSIYISIRLRVIHMQHITISTDSTTALKPLLESAIQTELRLLKLGIGRTRERIAVFEQEYELSSDEFEKLLHSDGIQENLDFIEWSGEIETLRRLQNKYHTLHEAHLT